MAITLSPTKDMFPHRLCTNYVENFPSKGHYVHPEAPRHALEQRSGGEVDPSLCQQDSQTYSAPKAPKIMFCITKAHTLLTLLLVKKCHSAR